jgi:hypothetical protein
VALLLPVGWLVAGVGAAAASVPIPRAPQIPKATPSDGRATFVSGNVTTCASVGFAASSEVQVGAPENMSASDANVAGTPKVNAGSTQPGVGEEVNVHLTGANIVIDAVVVKGGPAYNVYSNPASLPPTLAPDQHYISPVNPGGRVPALSHWFICYHSTTPPPPGSLTIDVFVDDPDGIPAVPPPSSYTVVVNCNDAIPAHHNDIVTIGAGGGENAGAVITGIAPGTICTVVEQGVASLPAGATEGDVPPAAATTGVTIPAGAGAVVDVVDNLAADPLETGTVQLVKVLVPGAPPGVPLPASYAAHASCDDGTETDVTLPGAGGTGTPIVTVPVLTDCLITEDTTSLPPGWVVTYTQPGGTPTATPPVVTVASASVTSVTVTNDPTGVAITTTAPTSTTVLGVAPTTAGTLPPTGGGTPTPLILGVALIGVGLVATGYATRKRNSTS